MEHGRENIENKELIHPKTKIRAHLENVLISLQKKTSHHMACEILFLPLFYFEQYIYCLSFKNIFFEMLSYYISAHNAKVFIFLKVI